MKLYHATEIYDNAQSEVQYVSETAKRTKVTYNLAGTDELRGVQTSPLFVFVACTITL